MFSTSVIATTLAASALIGGGSSGPDDCEPLMELFRPEELQHWTTISSRVWMFYTREENSYKGYLSKFGHLKMLKKIVQENIVLKK